MILGNIGGLAVMNFIDYDETNKDYWKNLYEEAFPIHERASTEELLFLRGNNNNIHLSLIDDDNKYVGLCLHVSVGTGKGFILYFAVDPELRGQNIGGQALKYLKEIYPVGFILESEQPSVDAPNSVQREKRVRFYEKNGVMNSHYLSMNQGGRFYLMRSSKNITVESYLYGVSLVGIETTVTNIEVLEKITENTLGTSK